MMAVDEQRLPVALLAVTAVWCLGLAMLGAHEALLFLAPGLLLAAPLAIRRYPGEKALLAISSLALVRARPNGRAPAPIGGFASAMPRGTLLLARWLAERAPPASART